MIGLKYTILTYRIIICNLFSHLCWNFIAKDNIIYDVPFNLPSNKHSFSCFQKQAQSKTSSVSQIPWRYSGDSSIRPQRLWQPIHREFISRWECLTPWKYIIHYIDLEIGAILSVAKGYEVKHPQKIIRRSCYIPFPDN